MFDFTIICLALLNKYICCVYGGIHWIIANFWNLEFDLSSNLTYIWLWLIFVQFMLKFQF